MLRAFLAVLLLAGLVVWAAGPAPARDGGRFPAAGATWRAITAPAPVQKDNSLASLAQEFLSFRKKLMTAVHFRLETPRHVRELLAYLHIQDEGRLIRGWFAHQALTAAQTPAYIVGVRSLQQTHDTNHLLRLLQSERRFARFQIPGAEQALLRIRAEKQSDRIVLQRLTDSLLETARAWEGRKWGHRDSGPEEMLQAVAVQLRRLAAAGEGGFVGTAYARPYTPADLILTLAARHILGQPLNEVSRIEHPDAQRCLRWAQLNLDQCMVSSHTPAEEAWCAGVHGVEEVSACWRFLLPDAN